MTSEPGGSSGIPSNSALSYVPENGATQDSPLRNVPAGVRAICEACARIYPAQTNPLQVATRLKYWLGGADPLDYISMYWNPGDELLGVKPHWHYVSFGLSDLHGDGRVHAPPLAPASPSPSGFGFELTMRVVAEGGEGRERGEGGERVRPPPPMWPAAIMQSLARYVFVTGNKFVSGDHISWQAPLAGAATGMGARAKVRHLLLADDPQLGAISSAHGDLTFLQLVGCTGVELRAAQRGSGHSVIHALTDARYCGPWLVTDALRAVSCRVSPRHGALAELAGVSVGVGWEEWALPEKPVRPPSPAAEASPPTSLLSRVSVEMPSNRTENEGHMSTDSFEMSSIERALPDVDAPAAPPPLQVWGSVRVTLDRQGARLLPLAVFGRVSCGAHFTFGGRESAVTLLGRGVGGGGCSARQPYASRGGWLQIYLSEELIEAMTPALRAMETSADDSDDEEEAPLPEELEWPRHGLRITITPT